MVLRVLTVILAVFALVSCKGMIKVNESGSFEIVNQSDKVIEFIWIAPEGEFYPTAKNINIGKDENYILNGLESGLYDIAIDFKGEYNSFNSKKDKSLCLKVDKGVKVMWYIDKTGNIIRNR